MQLKALAALISVALTLGVEAAPSSFDPAAGVKGHLKRSASHGVGHGVGVDLAKRATALVAKKRVLKRHGTRDADGKGCEGKNGTDTTPTDTTPAADKPADKHANKHANKHTNKHANKPAADKPAETNTTNTPTPLAVTLPTTTPATNDNNGGSGNNDNNNNSGAKDDKTLWLDAHNYIRKKHGASDLTWSDDLASAAAKWASGCIWEHSEGKVGPYGENMVANPGKLDINGSVTWMASEIADYDPNNPTYSHFTQIVWKATTQLGCAIADCSHLTGDGIDPNSAYQFGVCEYNPPGNVDGQYGENVQKEESN